MDNLSEALKQSEKNNGEAQEVKNDKGEVIGYCGILLPNENSFDGLMKVYKRKYNENTNT